MESTTSAVALALLPAILIGAALGLLGAAPLLFVLGRALKAQKQGSPAPSIRAGIVAVALSAAIGMVEIYLVYVFLPGNIIEIGVSIALIVLISVLAYGLAVWHVLSATRRNT